MILGYTFTVLNYLCYCVSRFMKEKHMMLAFDLLAKVFCVLGLFFIGSLSGAYSFACNFFWVIFAYIKVRKGCRWPAVYAVFQALLILILVTQYAGISSILVFFSMSASLLSTWWLPPQGMRVMGIPLNAITLCYQLSIRNWAGLLELLVIASNAASFIKYRKARQSGRT